MEIELDVHLETKSFDLKTRLRGKTSQNIQQPKDIKGVSLKTEGTWVFLLLHFTKQQKVELVLKSANEEAHQSTEFSIKDHFPDKG